MNIENVDYVASFVKEEQCPKDKRPEFAFIGRSNVGKSSLINMLCRRKDLAKVSKTPGKTQKLNYFDVDGIWYLVDLPGYGYAKVSQKLRADWEKMINYYLKNRVPLQCAFVLIDSRHDLQTIDHEFINWCGTNSVPFAIVYTKTDKLKAAEVNSNIRKIQRRLSEDWEELPKQFSTSAELAKGRDELLNYIDEMIKGYHPNK